MDTILIVDGNAIMHRAYHAIPKLTGPNNTPINALYGFLTMLYKAVLEFKPSYLFVAFDTPTPTFRQELLPTYQSQRPKSDAEFITQIPLIREMLRDAHVCAVEKGGFEADDVIGTIAKKYQNTHSILILTGDKDIMQLVNDRVTVVSPKMGLSHIIRYDAPEVQKKLGVTPDKIPELKALMGDPSDNYVGAKGIGPKTALKLLAEFHTVDDLLLYSDRIKDDRTRGIINENKQNIALSKTLATINTNVPIELDLQQAKFQWFDPKLKLFLEKQNIKSLKSRIFPDSEKVNGKEEPQTKTTQTDQIGLF